METIKNYLENMFSTMPDTSEVLKAKEELYQMMEDKYLELKSEGKSENEAIGIVIAEFGNLDEIKEELGIGNNTSYYEDTNSAKEVTFVSMDQVKEYIGMIGKFSNYIALGVMLCIFSPICLILLGGLTEISAISENVAGFGGLVVLFLFIIVAVAIFIYTGNQMQDYEYLKKEVIKLENATEIYLRQERKNNRNNFSLKIIIGVVLCILGVTILLSSAFFLSDFACIVAVCLMLFLIGIGVYFFVKAGMEDESYKILLQEGDYNKESKSKQMEAISSAYWCIVTAIYLAWSFITFKWGITWIVWPIAGVLYGAIAAIVNIIKKVN